MSFPLPPLRQNYFQPPPPPHPHPLLLKISSKDTSFHIFIHSPGLYLYLQNACWIFFQNVWEKFSSLSSSHSYKMHWFEAFLLMPLSTQNSPLSTCHHALGRNKLLIPQGSILSKIYFPQQQEEVVEETMIYFIKIQSENIKMTWNIRFFTLCMTYNFFKCDVYTVL